MVETSYHPCTTLSEYKNKNSDYYKKNKYEDTTIRQLIKDIRKDLQDSKNSWDPEAVQKITGDLSFIEKEYDSIPQLVAAYEQFYPDLKESGPKYCTAEHQWNSIKEWDDNSPLDKTIRSAIEGLRNEDYQDDTDENFYNNLTHPRTIMDEAEKKFRSIKSCFDQIKDEEELTTKMYTDMKDFKKKVEGWLGDLTTLHGKANEHNLKKKYRSLHAVRLEACQVWKHILRLSSIKQEPTQAAPPISSTYTSTTHKPKNHDWFKEVLTEHLKSSLIAKHEVFRWHDDWLKNKKALDKAKEAYAAFTRNRRDNFMREAEDVPPQALSKQEPEKTPPTTGTTATSTTDTSTTYPSTTA